jgi:Family of unknown function (DUF6152)
MNVRNCIRVIVAAPFVLGAASAQAHHSFNDIFDVNTVTTLKGTISTIDWINPHVYINVAVKDSSGKVTTWGVESPPTNHLRSAGISRQDLWNDASAGEVVTVHVNPAKGVVKAERPLGLLMRITYADGHFFHVRGDPKEIAAAK